MAPKIDTIPSTCSGDYHWRRHSKGYTIAEWEKCRVKHIGVDIRSPNLPRVSSAPLLVFSSLHLATTLRHELPAPSTRESRS